MSFSCNVSHADTFHPHLMMCTNMTTILSHQEDLGPSMLDVKYEGLGGTGFVTTPLNMAPNLSECNVSHGGIALKHFERSNGLDATHTCVRAYVRTYIRTYVHTYMCTCVHVYIRAYVHFDIRTYIIQSN